MSQRDFDRLCAVRDALAALGLTGLLERMERGEDIDAELERMIEDEQ